MLPEELSSRLERLERENRRWKRGWCLTALFVFLAACAGFVAPEERVVEAERFVLVDAEGAELGSLGPDDAGVPQLLLQREGATMLLTLAGPSLLFRGGSGKRSAFLGLDARGTTRLELTGDELFDGLRLAVQPDGSNGVYLLDGKGRERGVLESLSNGATQLSARDGEGRVRMQLGLDAEDVPNLLFLNAAGSRRLGMLLQTDDRPLLAIEDNRGRPRAELTTDFDGKPLFRLLREDGGVAFEAP